MKSEREGAAVTPSLIHATTSIRRFTRKLAVPSVIAVPTRNPARYRSA